MAGRLKSMVTWWAHALVQEKHTPPRPNSEDVFRFCTPHGRAFVANFTGVALEGAILQQAKNLAEALKRYLLDCDSLHFHYVLLNLRE